MVANDLKIPERLKVGFVNRNKTFTGKLAYVIYYDNKGKLRKEQSWDNWRDSRIPTEDLANVPTRGFELNKNVGGYQSGWNHRNSYIRVYDPRGFEFEITIENLMYILSNVNTDKKILDGEFVYAWSGADLVLMPVNSPDYAEIKEFSDKIVNNQKVYAKDLVVGHTYLTNKNEEYVYMGRFDKWVDANVESEDRYRFEASPRSSINRGKHHYFGRILEEMSSGNDYRNRYRLGTIVIKSPTSKFVDTVSTEESPQLQKMLDLVEYSPMFSPLTEDSMHFYKYTKAELMENAYKYATQYQGLTFYFEDKKIMQLIPADRERSRELTMNSNQLTPEEAYDLVKDETYIIAPRIFGSYQSPPPLYEGTIKELVNQHDFYYLEQRLANGKLYYSHKSFK